MLIRKQFLEGIAAGKVEIAFRRWERPTVKTGGTLKTAVGLLRIERVAEVPLSSLSVMDARLAGYETLETLLAELSARGGGSVYRIDLHREGPDPRIALREKSEIPPDEIGLLKAKLNRFDASGPYGPWTRCVLESILAKPKEKAGDMSLRLGFPKDWLKINIRKLKNLGLTISHEPGYELSPRGKRLLKLLRGR
jgi:hypothetical protein